MLILKGATILPQTKKAFVGDIAIDGKTIKSVSANICPADSDIVYDMSGKYITPGFIDAHSHIGVFNDGMADEGSDGNEMVEPFSPELRGLDSVNPFDRCFVEARQGGVTTVVTGPGSANVLAGQFVMLNTYGDCIEEMLFPHKNSSYVAMKAAFGENPKRVYGDMHKSPTTRMATAAILRKSLIDAIEYDNKRQKADDDNPADLDFQQEALMPIIHRELPLKIHCHRADDILTAVRICNEFNILYTLDHCTEGYMITNQLKKELEKNCIGIIIGPLFSDRSKIELKNQTFEAPRILFEAGIPFAMMTDSPVIPQQYLSVSSAFAVREGLPEDEALKSITINPAKILGIDDLVGSIDVGKLADIAVFSGDPLDMRSRCQMTIINGKIVHNEL